MPVIIIILLFLMQGWLSLDLDLYAPLFSFLQFFVVFFICRYKRLLSARQLLIQLPIYTVLIVTIVNICEHVISGIQAPLFKIIFPIGLFNLILAIAGLFTVSLVLDYPIFKNRILNAVIIALVWLLFFLFAVRPLIGRWIDYSSNPYYNKSILPQSLIL